MQYLAYQANIMFQTFAQCSFITMSCLHLTSQVIEMVRYLLTIKGYTILIQITQRLDYKIDNFKSFLHFG